MLINNNRKNLPTFKDIKALHKSGACDSIYNINTFHHTHLANYNNKIEENHRAKFSKTTDNIL